MTPEELKREKQLFVDRYIPASSREEVVNKAWKLSWKDAGQAARSAKIKLYLEEKDNEKFQQHINKWIAKNILHKYVDSSVSPELHMRHIKDISDYASKNDFGILKGEKFNGCLKVNEDDDKYRHCDTENKFWISVSQKLFNMQLKYMWCHELIKEPPHCPIDGYILEIAGINKKDERNTINWGFVNCVGCYEKIMARMEKEAKKDSLSLAQWELKRYREYVS